MEEKKKTEESIHFTYESYRTATSELGTDTGISLFYFFLPSCHNCKVPARAFEQHISSMFEQAKSLLREEFKKHILALRESMKKPSKVPYANWNFVFELSQTEEQIERLVNYALRHVKFFVVSMSAAEDQKLSLRCGVEFVPFFITEISNMRLLSSPEIIAKLPDRSKGPINDEIMKVVDPSTSREAIYTFMVKSFSRAIKFYVEVLLPTILADPNLELDK